MDTILHVGTHRTGTTSFQRYMRQHKAALAGQAVGFWGPWRTRGGLLNGLLERPRKNSQSARAAGRVRMNLTCAERRGTAVLIVSDENMLGTARANLRAGKLYPDAGERMARAHAGFGAPRRIVLQIRSLDQWWASALSFLVARGLPVPDADTLQAIAHSPRSWRQVITDLSCAWPGSEIMVTPFERFGARPDRLFHRMTGSLSVPFASSTEFWANRSPDRLALQKILHDRADDPSIIPPGQGRWMPFSQEQASALREAYADDLFWLRAGADGLAFLTEETEPEGPANKLATGFEKRGRHHDRSARRLEKTR
ncbi:hypothetical protein [Thalassococcus lentus]|uniref:Sulfotransferase family protein n=1 Tax=Thalassococcus lentus TaxID=1210524 RepID=A0ABT4XV92_9RHOB|nr:hypothetical protein [Thalassococcus lentus]MDA7425890.1 hypothetical protein [Thalassococcus lentus]